MEIVVLPVDGGHTLGVANVIHLHLPTEGPLVQEWPHKLRIVKKQHVQVRLVELTYMAGTKSVQCNKGIQSLVTYKLIVDGEWSDWSNYDDCTVTCGTGSQSRSRECNSPVPSNGGSNCSGETSERRDCKDTECPGMSCLAHLIYSENKTTQSMSVCTN